MIIPKRRFWAIRTDRNNKSLLLAELKQGRLRQGWGQDVDQDLRLVQAEILSGGAWRKRLSGKQEETLPQLRMLSSTDDSVKLGDWIVVPNLPEDGYFIVTEVAGEYFYEPMKLSKDHDIHELGVDYGHVLPIRVLTDLGINKYADYVDARIRATLRTPMRMWNLDDYGQAIQLLVEKCQTGADLSTPKSGKARLETAWETALSHGVDALRTRLGPEMDVRFQAAEWEEPIKMVLEVLYPSADVRWVAGPQESGADVIVQIRNHFGGLPWIIVIQVKNYSGEIGPSVVTQLRTAYDRYSKDGKLLSLVVMTTAEKMSPTFRQSSDALSRELGVPVKLILRDEMVKIISEGLMSKPRSFESGQ